MDFFGFLTRPGAGTYALDTLPEIWTAFPTLTPRHCIASDAVCHLDAGDAA
jgi:hypothetical protein